MRRYERLKDSSSDSDAAKLAVRNATSWVAAHRRRVLQQGGERRVRAADGTSVRAGARACCAQQRDAARGSLVGELQPAARP